MTTTTPTPKERAAGLLRRFKTTEAAQRYARNMEDRYESAHWQAVGVELDRMIDRVRSALAKVAQ